MARTARYSLTALALDPAAPQPLHRQLYAQLRAAILEGRMAPGERLPSSRLLAEELACARGTVLLALDQLHAEGYLQSRGGSGTYVAEELPDHLLALRQGTRSRRAAASAPPRLSRNATLLIERGARASHADVLPFAIGRPALDAFPRELWAKLVGESWRGPAGRQLLPQSPSGVPELRRAIADYLRAARGLDCRPEEVIVTGGTQQALNLIARLLLDPGDRVWLEEPGYPALRATLLAAGAETVAVPIDAEGISVAAGRRSGASPRLIAVAPSHQFPLGTVMSLGRRLELLRYADEAEAWIVEDDYDSEYRYRGRPLEPLRLLDQSGRVLYVGTFSKVLFPGLRLGYLVAPAGLAEIVGRAIPFLEPAASTAAQAALARFIADGHFAVHLRRMRQLYAERQAALIAAAERHLGGRIALAPEEAGMHLVGYPTGAFAESFDDNAYVEAAGRAGIVLAPLSRYYAGATKRSGLIFGYSGVAPPVIDAAMARLAPLLLAPQPAPAKSAEPRDRSSVRMRSGKRQAAR